MKYTIIFYDMQMIYCSYIEPSALFITIITNRKLLFLLSDNIKDIRKLF